MRLKKMLHAIGKIMSGPYRVMGDYLETINDRLEMLLAPPFQEYAAIKAQRVEKKVRRSRCPGHI